MTLRRERGRDCVAALPGSATPARLPRAWVSERLCGEWCGR